MKTEVKRYEGYRINDRGSAGDSGSPAELLNKKRPETEDGPSADGVEVSIIFYSEESNANDYTHSNN